MPVILLEDIGALLGLVFALIGVGMTLITENGYWDVAGTAAIGILLVIIAVTLAIEMSSLLVGEGASENAVDAIGAALAGDGSGRVIHLRTLYVGPEELLVAAKIGVEATQSGEEIAEAINAAGEPGSERQYPRRRSSTSSQTSTESSAAAPSEAMSPRTP